MKRNYSNQQSLINQRHSMINSLDVEDNINIRGVLNDALSYAKTVSEDGLEFQERDIKHLLINNIRHEKSNYDDGLRKIHKIARKLDHRSRNSSSYYLYKNATLDRISKAYPFLEKECKEQKHRMNMVKIKRT